MVELTVLKVLFIRKWGSFMELMIFFFLGEHTVSLTQNKGSMRCMFLFNFVIQIFFKKICERVTSEEVTSLSACFCFFCT